MTPRFKDFGDGGVVISEPLSFKLHGQEFHCKPAIQGKVLLDMVATASSNDQAAATKVVIDFFNAVLTQIVWMLSTLCWIHQTRLLPLRPLEKLQGGLWNSTQAALRRGQSNRRVGSRTLALCQWKSTYEWPTTLRNGYERHVRRYACHS